MALRSILIADDEEPIRHVLTVLLSEHGFFVRAVKDGEEALREQVAMAAPTNGRVLIYGENGTGKELVARTIHALSRRRAAAFVEVNCAAIPEELIESELFGHVKGAFTGAVAAKRGLFEEADGGTLLLDEVGDLPLHLQVSLLRVLQEGECRRVGDARAIRVDVRVLAATHQDLSQAVAAGRFREDLFYRLNVVGLRLPPLRERCEEIEQLARRFLGRHAARLGIPEKPLSPTALQLLLGWRWPGNVRELENALERALVLSDGAEIEPEALPEELRASAAPSGPPPAPAEGDLSVKRAQRALEADLIRRALERTSGNRTRAAELLELSPRALLYKIRDYGIGE